MKRLFATIALCGFLAASVAQAAKPANHSKSHPSKAAQKQAKKIRKENARARKVAKARQARNKKAA